MCWKCGKAIHLDGPAGRSMTCPSCGADVRSCRNCRFYSPGAWHDCAERVEDAPNDKERANFCDSFQLNPAYRQDHAGPGGRTGSGAGGSGGSGADSSGPGPSARSAFDSLFNS